MNFLSSLFLILVSLIGIGLSWLIFPFPRFLKLLVGPAFGIIVFTQIALLVSLILGFNLTSISIAALVEFILLFISYLLKPSPKFFTDMLRQDKSQLTLIRHPELVWRSQISGSIKRILKNRWPLWLILITIGSVVTFIFWTKVLTPTEFGLTTGGEGLYGDTALHLSYAMSLVTQGLPPQNPLFASIQLRYPFLVNLFSASLVKLGMNLRFSFILPQLIYFLAFVALFYYLAKKVGATQLRHSGNSASGGRVQNLFFRFDSEQARMTGNLTAFFALLIFFLGWGLGFTKYLQDVKQSSSWLVNREYTNNLPGYNLHNVLTGLIFPERSFLPGLVIGLLIAVLAIQPFNHLTIKSSETKSDSARQSRIFPQFAIHNSKFLILIGFLLGILPLWHTHTFIFFGLAVGIWTILPSLQLTHPGPLLRREGILIPPLFKRRLGGVIFIYTIALLLALPALLWFRGQVTQAAFIHLTSGWIAGEHFLAFWWRNTGLLIPLALIGFLLLPKNKRIIFVPAFAMFIIANLVIFQPWDWDNIKLFSWVFLFLSIPAGHCLSVILGSPAQRDDSRIQIPDASARGGLARMTRGLFVLVLLFSLTASGILSLAYLANTEYTIYDKQDLELVAWVKTNTRPTDVFLVDPWPNHPVPGLTGRSVYLGYPGHLWVHGIDYGKRETLVKQVLEGNVSLIKSTDVAVNYLVAPSSDRGKFTSSTLNLVYANQKFVVYKINR